MLMADKSSFTSDEWQTLLESVMATGLAGIGGVAVDETEQATSAEISSALKLAS